MPKKTGPTTYTLASNEARSTTSTRSKKSKLHHHLGKKHPQHHHHGGAETLEDPVDPTDGTGSLTYSAASSVQSGGSAAGESTDSSFADIMRVLDLQDSSELKALIKKEGVSSERELREKRGLPLTGISGISVASSLNYSTDGESLLDGTHLLQTIAGQPSDSYGFDGGSGYHEQPIKGDNDNILFAPAAPVLNKKQRQKEKKARREAKAAGVAPKSKVGNRKTYPIGNDDGFGNKVATNIGTPTPTDRTANRRVVSPDGTPPNSASNAKPGSPPPLPPNRVGDAAVVMDEDDDVWYAKWWMSCFPDSFKNLMPKR